MLVDACDWHYDALNSALLETCGFKIGRREHENTFNGLPTQTKLGILEGQGRVNRGDFTPINTLKQQYTMEILENLTVDRVKVELHENVIAKGINVVCVTNAIRQSTETMLRNTGQLKYMKFVISNQDVVHPKPCAEGYIVAMIRLGIFPQNILIVEDSPKGIQAAESTGAYVLQVANAVEVTWDRLRKFLP